MLPESTAELHRKLVTSRAPEMPRKSCHGRLTMNSNGLKKLFQDCQIEVNPARNATWSGFE